MFNVDNNNNCSLLYIESLTDQNILQCHEVDDDNDHDGTFYFHNHNRYLIQRYIFISSIIIIDVLIIDADPNFYDGDDEIIQNSSNEGL